MSGVVLRRSNRQRQPLTSCEQHGGPETEDLTAAGTVPKVKRRRLKVEDPPESSLLAQQSTPGERCENARETSDVWLEPSPNREVEVKSERSAELPSVKEELGQQPYGAPPQGTLVPSVKGRMWKQPKVWNLPKPTSNGQMKRLEANIERKPKPIKPLAYGEAEVRLMPYIHEPSATYLDSLARADTQRLFILERTRGVEETCHAHHLDCPYETIRIAGSTGNVYTVRISHLTTCSCPASIYKKEAHAQCKHIIYVLHHVLRVSSELKYQAAFLTSELKSIFAHAPPLLEDVNTQDTASDGDRKPVEGDCPICFTEFDENADEIVWCQAACGNNIHKQCFKQWERATAPNVRCPFCRTDWATSARGSKVTAHAVMNHVVISEERGRGGYRNVYDQLDYAQ